MHEFSRKGEKGSHRHSEDARGWVGEHYRNNDTERQGSAVRVSDSAKYL